MKNGGKRPGAGRPKGAKNASTLSKEECRELLREVVRPEIAAMTQAQIENAKGLRYLVARDKLTGKFTRLTAEMASRLGTDQESDREVIEVWEKDPNVSAFTDLMNRTLDMPAKPVEQHEHSGEFVVRWKGE